MAAYAPIIYRKSEASAIFDIPFDYLSQKFIVVMVEEEVKTFGTDYDFLDKTRVRFLTGNIPAGIPVTLKRATDASARLVSWRDASVLRASDLELSQLQVLHVSEEAAVIARLSLAPSSYLQWDAQNRRIVRVAPPIDDLDAVNKEYFVDYIAELFKTGQGPVNSAANILFAGPKNELKTVQDLSGPDGTQLIGRGTRATVEDSLVSLEGSTNSLAARADTYDALMGRGALKYLTTERHVNFLIRSDKAQISVASKEISSGRYDHFGQMDVLPNGTPCLFYRSGLTHAEDNGAIVFTTLSANGTWSPPNTVAREDIYDMRDPAGGVMPSGRLVVATTLRSLATPALFPELRIYISDDYGASWTLKQSIPSGGTMRFAHGKGFAVGDKYCIPYYTNAAPGRTLRLLESSDGGETWSEGALIYSGTTDFNETGYVNLGGGLVLAASRADFVGGGKIRLWRSNDGATTWTDLGYMTGAGGDSTDVLVSPSLCAITMPSGMIQVFLFYTNRTTTQLMYRSIPRPALVGTLPTWSARHAIYSAPNLSGYQSHVVLGNRILGNFFRETLPLTVAGAYQWEVYPGELPDYESAWTAVVPSTTYTFTHGLTKPPKRVIVEFATSTNPAQVYVVQASYYNDAGVNKGSGAQVAVSDAAIVVGTGAAVWGTAYFGNDATRFTAGFYRVRAWL